MVREYKDTYTLEAQLTGDTSRLKKAIDRANALLSRLENDSGEVEITGDNSQLQRTIVKSKSLLGSLQKSSKVDIEADSSDLNSDVAKSLALIEKLKSSAKNIAMKLTGYEKVKAKIDSIKKEKAKVNVETEFDSKASEGRIAKFKAMLKSIPNRLKTEVKVDVDRSAFNILTRLNAMTDEFQNNMGRMANSIRSFGTVMMNQIQGLLMMMSTALVPAIASIVPAVMAVGNAIGVTFGGAIGTVGALGIAFSGVAVYGGLVASVLGRYNDEAFVATEASNKFSNSLDTIKSSWSGIVDQNIDTIFTTMSTAIDGANHALNAMNPFINGVVQSMSKLSDRINTFLSESLIMQDFYENMNTVGVRVFDNLMNAGVSFFEGLFDSMNALMPLFDWVAQGINNMAERFSSWAQRMSAENGFEPFINYVKTNLPLVGQIFGNTFMGIINLFSAFGQNSNLIFQKLAEMTARFREWSAGIKESDGFQKFVEYVQTNGPVLMSLIGNIIMTLVNLGIALAPLGQKVLELTDKFFGFTSELLKAHPIVGVLMGAFTVLTGAVLVLLPVITQLIAIWHQLIAPMLTTVRTGGLLQTALSALGSAFGFLTAPILAIIAVITALVASFIYLWQTNEQFRSKVIEIWTQIQTHISNAITAVKDFIMNVWGTVVEWWATNNENIMNVVEVVWTGILNAIQGTMNTIVPIIQVAWEVIKTIVTVALNVILGIVGTVMAILNGDWATAWENIKTTALNIWEAIKTMFINVWNIIKTAFTTWLNALLTQASLIWNNIKTVATVIWTAIKTAIMTVVTDLVQKAILIFFQMKGRIEAVFTIIKFVITTIWNAIKTVFSVVLATILTIVTTAWNNIKMGIQVAMTVIKTIITTIWNTIKSVITTVLNAIKSVVTSVWNAIRSFITSAMNTIRSVITSIWNAIRSVVTSVLNTIRSIVTSVFNAIRSVITSVMNTIRSIVTSVWNAIRSIITSVVNAVRSVVTSGFNAMRSIVQSVMNAIRSTITSIWNGIKSTVTSVLNGIKSAVSNIFNSLKGIVTSAMSNVRSAVSTGMNNAKNAITSMFGSFREAGSNVVSSIADGIRGAIGKVTSAIGDVAQTIRNHLPFSPAKEGPLRSIMKTNVAGSIAETIEKQRKLPVRAMRNVTGNIQSVIDKYNPTLTPQLSGFTKGIKSAQSGMQSVMSHTVKAEVNSQPIQADISLDFGRRNYQTHIEDISHAQNETAKLDERYGI